MNLDRYPRVKKFLNEHPEMTFDEAFKYIEKLEGDTMKCNICGNQMIPCLINKTPSLLCTYCDRITIKEHRDHGITIC